MYEHFFKNDNTRYKNITISYTNLMIRSVSYCPTIIWPFFGGILFDYFGFRNGFIFYFVMKVIAIAVLIQGVLGNEFIVILAG